MVFTVPPTASSAASAPLLSCLRGLMFLCFRCILSAKKATIEKTRQAKGMPRPIPTFVEGLRPELVAEDEVDFANGETSRVVDDRSLKVGRPVMDEGWGVDDAGAEEDTEDDLLGLILAAADTDVDESTAVDWDGPDVGVAVLFLGVAVDVTITVLGGKISPPVKLLLDVDETIAAPTDFVPQPQPSPEAESQVSRHSRVGMVPW